MPFEKNKFFVTEMSPYIFIRVSIRPHCGSVTGINPDRYGPSRGGPESEPGSDLRVVAPDREKNDAGVQLVQHAL